MCEDGNRVWGDEVGDRIDEVQESVQVIDPVFEGSIVVGLVL